jgi:hypothetical protein
MPTSRISFQSVNADDQVEVSSDRTSVFVTVLEVGYRGWKSRQITERKKIRFNPTGFNPISFNSISFNPIGFNPVGINSISFNSISFNPFGFNSVSFNSVNFNQKVQYTTYVITGQ